MPYIYKITNDINNKVYIGKTLDTIEKRWKEHCRDYKKETENSRPLYRAITKYGLEHFSISILEECDKKILDERERFWIEYYRSFKYGYNATLGGDGRAYCDYDLILALYNNGFNLKQIAEKLKYDSGTCSKALKTFGVTPEELKDRGRDIIKKVVFQLDKDTNEIINVFPSIKEAYDSLGKQHSGHIASVCNGKRKTAYGYKWKYYEKN